MDFDPNNPHVLTAVTKRKVFLLEPEPDQFELADLLLPASQLYRYCGCGISVLQHCVNVCKRLDAAGFGVQTQLAGLFHDLEEAWTGDISSPLKAAMRSNDFYMLEWVTGFLRETIYRKFGIQMEKVNFEAIELVDLSERDYECANVYSRWPAESARIAFMREYQRLTSVAWDGVPEYVGDDDTTQRIDGLNTIQ